MSWVDSAYHSVFRHGDFISAITFAFADWRTPSIFEAWDIPIAQLIIFAILLIHGWLLRNKAENARESALYWIKRRILRLEGESVAPEENRVILSQARAVLAAMEKLNTGAIAPTSQIATAIFIIITGISGLKITEYSAITQL